MLRQALDDAEEGEQRRAADLATKNESNPLLFHGDDDEDDDASSNMVSQYGSTATALHRHLDAVLTSSDSRHRRRDGYDNDVVDGTDGGGVDDDLDDDDDDDSSFRDTDEDEKSVETVPPPLWELWWSRVKTLVRVVANVENLWDSPLPPSPQPRPLSSSLLNDSNHRSSTLFAFAQQQRRRFHNQKKYVVLFWFVVLALSYASERSTFKLLVDRTGPFRLFSVQMLTGCHAFILACGLVVSSYQKLRLKQHCRANPTTVVLEESTAWSAMHLPLGIPYADCILMAVLDTITLVLVFLTGEHVPPTLTVILVQFTIPLAAFLSQFTHPDGHWTCCCPSTPEQVDSNNHNEQEDNQQQNENRNPLLAGGSHMFAEHISNGHDDPSRLHSNSTVTHTTTASYNTTNGAATTATTTHAEPAPIPGWGGLAATHIYGSLILCAAVSLALCPAFYSIAHPEFFYYADQIPIRTAINTLFFVSSCIPAAASQLYKEHIFLQYKQPVNMIYLNLLLSVFQFIFCSIASPLLYGLQGLGSRGDWTKLYPASGVSENFWDGLKCFFGVLSVIEQEDKYPEEAYCRWALGLVLVHVFAIISVGVAVDKIVNAGATKVMYRGISAGIIVAVLSMHFYDMHLPDFAYGPGIDALNLVCLVLLVLGSEVYHRTGLHEATFETIYPVIEIPTFDD